MKSGDGIARACRHVKLRLLVVQRLPDSIAAKYQIKEKWVLLCAGLATRHSTSSSRLLGAGWLPLGPSAAAWTCTTGSRHARR